MWQAGIAWGLAALGVLGGSVFCGFRMLSPGESRVHSALSVAFFAAAAGAAFALGCAVAFMKGLT